MEKDDCRILARAGLPIKYIDSTKIYFVKLHLYQFLSRQIAPLLSATLLSNLTIAAASKLVGKTFHGMC